MVTVKELIRCAVVIGLLLGSFSAFGTTNIKNPMLWADVPDPDVIRVGNYFYMVSTTMHLMPGAPIMRSRDMKNWETVSYLFNRLTDSPKYDMKDGTVYGLGQWATSLKYYKGKFYALFAPNDYPGGDTYIYTAEKAEGHWSLLSRMRHFHDASLFFDDDGRVYVVYGTGQMCELKSDLSGIIEGSDCQLFRREPDETGLLEGSRMIKYEGKYYLLMISWPVGKPRRQVCYRSNNIRGPYEKKVILESEFGGFSYVGQGTIVDTPKGDWLGVIFQDRGGVGRVLTLMPCCWLDGWPMLGDEQGRVPDEMPCVVEGEEEKPLVVSDDFNKAELDIHWQWNHNPIDEAWSLTDRNGWLRLKSNRIVSNLYEASNTLTQRMMGPRCSASVKLDISHLQDGDRAGFAAFNGHSGVLALSREGTRTFLTLSKQVVNFSKQGKMIESVDVEEQVKIRLKKSKVWLRIDGDFLPGHDLATFFYSFDGKHWMSIGKEPFKMQFDYRRLFMGTKYALFHFSTLNPNGYTDFDFFHFAFSTVNFD